MLKLVISHMSHHNEAIIFPFVSIKSFSIRYKEFYYVLVHIYDTHFYNLQLLSYQNKMLCEIREERAERERERERERGFGVKVYV